MLHVAVLMLLGDRAKFVSLLVGITFATFLIAFAISYFAGFMSRSFALIDENPTTDVWVMDRTVRSVDQATNIPDFALFRVRSVSGVAAATPLALGAVDARFPDGRFQSFQVIGVDDATLTGAPLAPGNGAALLRIPQSALIDAGGTDGKLQMRDRPGAVEQERLLRRGDELQVNDKNVAIVGVSNSRPRFPPRPLLYTSFSNALRILPAERHRTTFIRASVAQGATPARVAQTIERETGLRARPAADFRSDTVHWQLSNSEDVGDIAAMLSMAIMIGFGVTGVMLYIFTVESMRQYAVLKAMGATPALIRSMVFVQASLCGALGAGLGLGLCTVAGWVVTAQGYPFRMMWFTPLAAVLLILIVCIVSALVSVRPVLRLSPATVFAGR